MIYIYIYIYIYISLSLSLYIYIYIYIFNRMEIIWPAVRRWFVSGPSTVCEAAIDGIIIIIDINIIIIIIIIIIITYLSLPRLPRAPCTKGRSPGVLSGGSTRADSCFRGAKLPSPQEKGGKSSNFLSPGFLLLCGFLLSESGVP